MVSEGMVADVKMRSWQLYMMVREGMVADVKMLS